MRAKGTTRLIVSVCANSESIGAQAMTGWQTMRVDGEALDLLAGGAKDKDGQGLKKQEG